MRSFVPGYTSTGGPSAEIINGGVGDDLLYGNGGNDRIDGREGNDLLDGGEGDDFLIDGDGNNHLIGGKGDDSLIDNGPGSSILEGGEGNDWILLGDGSSSAFGGDGNDVLTARGFQVKTARSLALDGGNGNDFFDLYTYAEKMTLAVTGGAGRDIFQINSNSATTAELVITDFKTGIGGDQFSISAQADMVKTYAPLMLNPFVAGYVRLVQNGADTLVQAKHVTFSDVTKTSGVSKDFVTIAILRNVVADQIVAANIVGFFDPTGLPSFPMRLEGDALPDRLTGGLSGDVIFGNGGIDHLTGMDGNDEIHGGEGDDWLLGQDGDDVLYGDDGKDAVNGGAGNNRMYGGAGDDSLISLEGDDVLDGGAGNDSLFASHGNDTLSGGDGNDTITPGTGADKVDGGSGIDTVNYASWEGNVVRRVAGGVEVTVSGAADGSDTDLLVNVERINIGGEKRTWAMDIDGNAGQAYRLYQAAFNRTPDPAGLSYWIGALDKGTVKLIDIASLFISSDEFKSLYGAAPSNAYFLDKLYDNILHRKPDPAGFNYWLEVLDKKYATAPELLASFSESAENVAALVGTIGDGFWINWS
jgi:Ca2+-binding RTX toxin-like protein